MVHRRRVLSALAAAGAVSVAGCASVEEDEPESDDGDGVGGDDAAGEADLWYALSEGELVIVEEAIETFNSETDYAITGEDIAELEDQLTTAIPAGEGPETFFWAHDWMGDFVESQFVADRQGDIGIDLDQFTDAGREAVEYEGGVYGLPIGAETVGLFYNEELVDEPPESWDEFYDVAEEYNDQDGMYGLSYPLDPYFYSAYAHMYGGFYFDDEGEELGLTDEETLDGFRFVLDELEPLIPDDPDYDAQAAVFSEGNAPFAINGPWEFGGVDFDLSVTTLPAPDGETPAPYTGIQVAYFADAITEDAERAEAAHEFADWYTTNLDILERLAEDQGIIPVHEDLAGEDELPDLVQGFSESAANGFAMPASPLMNQVWGPVEDGFMNAYTGDMSLEDAMAEAEDRIRGNWD